MSKHVNIDIWYYENAMFVAIDNNNVDSLKLTLISVYNMNIF